MDTWADGTSPASRRTPSLELGDTPTGSPHQLEMKTVGSTALNWTPESLTLGSTVSRSCCTQSGLSFLRNLFSTKDGSPTCSSAAERVGSTKTLSPEAPAEGEQRWLPAGNVALSRNSCAHSDEKNAGHVRVPGVNQERSGATGAAAKNSCAGKKHEEMDQMSVANNFHSTWHLQGLLDGTLEELDWRSGKLSTSSLSAMLFSGEASPVTPTALSMCSEQRGGCSTKLAEAIRLSLQYAPPPFMSISSDPSSPGQSMPVVLTSMGHLMHNSQHWAGCSPSHSGVCEVLSLDKVSAAEELPLGALPLDAGSVPTKWISKSARGKELSFAPPSRETKRWPGKLPPIRHPSTLHENNSFTAAQASPLNPCAPTLPCSPVLIRVTPSIKSCVVEEQREREAYHRNQEACFEGILASEISAYLAISRLASMKACQSSGYCLATAQRKLVEEETLLMRESMHTRMRITETDHESSINLYRLMKPVGLPSPSGREPQSSAVSALGNQVDRSTAAHCNCFDHLHLLPARGESDGGLTTSTSPLQPSIHASPVASSETQESTELPVKTEIQRQLRLDRQFSRKKDEWTTDPIFLKFC